MRGGSKPPMHRTADQMPLNIEYVVDRGMDRNEALRRALHLSFASSNWLMRVLRTVVGTQALFMQSRTVKLAKRGSVRSQFIGDDNRGSKALATQEFTEQAQGRCLVTLGLNENVKNLAFAIDSAPHVHLFSRD
jgi:hypothetical protein